ncbi:MAG TPA: hypothetical protein VFG68_11370 [Fimbriiglobus sp.]|nr:hypothetical protein [Fimbriiglobus sp.]
MNAVPTYRSPPADAATRARATRTALFWLQGFILLQFACQVALLFEALSPFRVVFRSAAFLVSLVALVLVPGVTARHPSRWLLYAALAVLGLNFFHPATNTPLTGAAEFALNLAVVAPLFWVSRLQITPAVVARVMLLIWGFHTLSASVGVVQTYFPGTLQPAISSVVDDQGIMAEGLKIELPDGTKIWRPMGLTDVPGGSSMSGLYAVLFGMGYAAVSRRWSLRLAGAGSMTVGLFCIYLTQIRVALVVSVIVAVAFVAALAWARRAGDAVRLLAILAVVAVGSFVWALAVGGELVTERFGTLVEDAPGQVYFSNRGQFLTYTVTELLPEHPFGAGLGRWGMVRSYFGDELNPRSTSIWVEIQWTAWVTDGGAPLALAYAAAILVAGAAVMRAARHTPDRWLAGWAALGGAYTVAVFGLTFSYTPFIGQIGMEFWMLNSLLVTAARTVARARRDGVRL